MFGLNIKITAYMLVNILMVHGKIYQEDRYVMDSKHIERYHRLYSDNDRSDVFDNADSKLNFDVPELDVEDLGEKFRNAFPGSMEHNNGLEEDPIRENIDTEKGLLNTFPIEDNQSADLEDARAANINFARGLPYVWPVEDKRLDLENPHAFDFDLARKWPHNMFPVDHNGFPNNVNDEMKPRPRWIPGGVGDDKNRSSGSKPGRGEMKRKCRNIKGLPTPDSGCCGVQMTKRPIEYPNERWFPQIPDYPGRRFSRSANKDTLPSSMIRGGKATDLHQFPWMVLLSIDTTVSGIGTPKSCGGTIISSRYVLTAAHCLHDTYKNLNQLSVILAEYNSDTYPKDCNRQGCIQNKKRNVEHIIIHPDFNNTYLQNDIALLRLDADIGYSDYIRPVCLPAEDIADLSENPLIIAGWGLNGRTESNLKRSAIVNYVPDTKCEEEYCYKDDSMFCSIGSNGEDICHGDSGGPLMVHSDGKFFLSGIVSGKRKTEECGSTVPSLFNNVFRHLEWIKHHVR